MIKNVYCIRDLKSCFGNTFLDDSDIQARRNFQFCVSDPGSTLHRFPDDFHLYRIGSFDTETGVLTSLSPAEFVFISDARSLLGGASECLN